MRGSDRRVYTDYGDTRKTRLRNHATLQRLALAHRREQEEEEPGEDEREGDAKGEEEQRRKRRRRVIRCPVDLRRVVEMEDIARRSDRSLILADVRNRRRKQELARERGAAEVPGRTLKKWTTGEFT
jgi:hypothetical protein